jgi:hypothetical protein
MPARSRQQSTQPKRARIYGLRRIEAKRSHTRGWFVTLMRKGRTYSRHFSDQVYGGRGAALDAALRYRDQVIEEHPPMSRRAYAQIPRSDNRSGVRGVYRVAIPRPYKDRHYPTVWYWAALWSPQPGVHKRKSFSVKKYGEVGAFRRALAARRKGLEEMGTAFHINHPGQAPRGGRSR